MTCSSAARGHDVVVRDDDLRPRRRSPHRRTPAELRCSPTSGSTNVPSARISTTDCSTSAMSNAVASVVDDSVEAAVASGGRLGGRLDRGGGGARRRAAASHHHEAATTAPTASNTTMRFTGPPQEFGSRYRHYSRRRGATVMVSPRRGRMKFSVAGRFPSSGSRRSSGREGSPGRVRRWRIHPVRSGRGSAG